MTGHLRSLAFVRNKAYASAPERAGHRRIAAVPFTLRNFKEDLEDVGSRFDGAPELEFRLATDALELEQSGLRYQRVPPGAWRGYEARPEGLEILVIGAPNLGDGRREDVEGQRDWWAD
jgi:hypothetical protein